eukprot:TRINITY_DN13813_c0_g1_i2.p1 TRINITY_DN13813_c0_g1~~TRINITY_DN13813_c0_g1_i2.p1  ORF type:complete len:375 (+),score=73.53 TRINITY_DN13813_c0_g1_i2:165-1289(+)
MEEDLIFEEYRKWKKSSLSLYNLLLTNSLEWPSLTVEWMPYSITLPNYTILRVLFGTHAPKGRNHLYLAKVFYPLDFGFERRQGLSRHLHVEKAISHSGEVNRARHLPQMPRIVATQTPSSEIHIFDLLREPNPEEKDNDYPLIKLVGQHQEGFGLAWNPLDKGYLLSSCKDKFIYIWSIFGNPRRNSPLGHYKGHTDAVNDIAWSKYDSFAFASGSNDSNMLLWDMRMLRPTHAVNAHAAEVLSVDFSPFKNFLLASSSVDRSVAVWDLRNLGRSLCSLKGHEDEVSCVRWSPFTETLLASGSQDRSVLIWDLSKLQKDNSGMHPLFKHCGHTNAVADLAWSYHKDAIIASTARDNIMPVSYTHLTLPTNREV